MNERINPETTNIGIYCAYAMEGVVGGVQDKVRCTSELLKEKGYNVHIFAPLNANTDEFDENIIHLGQAGRHSFNGSVHVASRRPESFRYIDSLHDKYNLDIAHYHEPEISVPLMQDLLVSKAYNFTEFHSHNKNDWRFMLMAPLRYIYAHKITGRIAVSEAGMEFAKHYFPGEYEIIPNGVDCRRFKLDNPKIEKFQDGKVNILFVGRLEERKGLRYLIKAYQLVKNEVENCRLIVVGGGEKRKELEDFVKKENINDVCFQGQVHKEDLPSYYSTADIFSSPATHGESFGMVLTQAMASGKPIIAGDNPGHKTVVTGEEGILLDPKDTELFAAQLKKLILSPDERQRRGEAGLKKSKIYSWPKIVEKTEQLYLQKIAQRKKSKH